MMRIFISHTDRSEIDRKATTALVVELRRIGLDVWIDREHCAPRATRKQEEAGPTPENPLFERLVHALSECDAVLYVASPTSFSREYYRFELDPRILYQEFRKKHSEKQLKDLPFYVALVEPLVPPPPLLLLFLDTTWSGRIMNLDGSTPLILPTAITTMVKEIAPQHLYPLNPMTEWIARKSLEDNAKEAPGCPPGIAPPTWLRLQSYLGLGPLFPGPLPFDKPFDEDQLRYGMFRTGDAARLVDANKRMMTVPEELSILLILWTANMMLRSTSQRTLDGKDAPIEYSLPSCLREAIKQKNKELEMAVRLQFGFALLSSTKGADTLYAEIVLKKCKEYFTNLPLNLLVTLADVLYSRATGETVSQDSINKLKAIGIDPYDKDIRQLHHKILDAAFPGPRIEATEEYRSTIMSFRDNMLKSSSELKGGFAKTGQSKLNPDYWKKVEPPNEWYIKGASFFDAGEYNKAIECFDKALQINGNDTQALTMKGLTFTGLGIYEKAIECYDKALEIDSKYYFALGNKGIALTMLGRYQDAIECYDKVLQINPNDVLALSKKGEYLHYLGQHDAAIQCFDKALEIDPSDAMIWYNKAVCLVQLKQYSHSVECFDNSLEINPKYVYSWSGKGSALNVLAQYDAAIQCFDKALEIDPSDAMIWYNKGLSFLCLKKYDKANKCFDKALEIDPDYENAKELRNVSLEEFRKLST